MSVYGVNGSVDFYRQSSRVRKTEKVWSFFLSDRNSCIPAESLHRWKVESGGLLWRRMRGFPSVSPRRAHSLSGSRCRKCRLLSGRNSAHLHIMAEMQRLPFWFSLKSGRPSRTARRVPVGGSRTHLGQHLQQRKVLGIYQSLEIFCSCHLFVVLQSEIYYNGSYIKGRLPFCSFLLQVEKLIQILYLRKRCNTTLWNTALQVKVLHWRCIEDENVL